MRLLLIVVLLGLSLTACGGPKTITRAELEAAIYQEGDLPASVQAGQFLDAATVADAGSPEIIVVRDFTDNLSADDQAAIFIYSTSEAAQAQYPKVLPGAVTDGSPGDFGDQSNLRGNVVIFQRCRAVAFIRITAANVEESNVRAYARRLDDRLKAIVC